MGSTTGSIDCDSAFWDGRVVVVTGGGGFLGRPTVKLLEDLGADVRVPRSADTDLRDPAAAVAALRGADVVIHLAANVGGIGYGRRNPVPLIHDNSLMALGVFEAARCSGVSKLVAAGSVCSYPKFAPVPFRETDLWNGFPEETNAPYGLAKRLLITLSDAYRRQYGLNSCVPVLANLYGPGDDFSLEDSHVIGAMIRKFVEAHDRGDPEVILWGTGRPSREFLYVDDAARALVLAAERCDRSEPFNVGTGRHTQIRELAGTISRLVGYTGSTTWDETRPDGQPERGLDVSRARDWIGFQSAVSLEEGLDATIKSFRALTGYEAV